MPITASNFSSWFWPAATFLAGGIGTKGLELVSALARDRFSQQHTAKLKESDTREARRIRSDEFLRASLLSLQETATELLNAAEKSHLAELMLTIRHEPPPDYDDAARAYSTADAKVNMYNSRVRTDAIREQCAKFRAQCIEASICPTREDGRNAMKAARAEFNTLNKMIGVELRTLDDESRVTVTRRV